jgi:hypothetical protein
MLLPRLDPRRTLNLPHTEIPTGSLVQARTVRTGPPVLRGWNNPEVWGEGGEMDRVVVRLNRVKVREDTGGRSAIVMKLEIKVEIYVEM